MYTKEENKQDLIKALKALAEIDLEDFGFDTKADDFPVYTWNKHTITVGDCRAARRMLGLVINSSCIRFVEVGGQ